MWYAILGICLLATSVIGVCTQAERLLQNGSLALLLWGCGVAGSALATLGAPRVHRIWLLYAALGLRGLTFLGAPIVSDDVYRYVHEGRATRIGIEVPYTVPPNDVRPTPDDGISSRVNHPEITAAYPPFSQALMWAVVGIGDALQKPMFALRCVWMLFDAWLLAWFWRRRDRRPRAFGFYAFHVLPIWEAGVELHLDIVGATLCFAGWLFRFRPSLAGMLWGFAAGIKPLAVLAFAALARTHRRLRHSILFFILAVGVPTAPYLWQGVPIADGLRTYGTRWEANPTLYAVIEQSVSPAFLSRQAEGKWIHLHVAHSPMGVWLEEGHQTIFAIGHARPIQDPWLIDQRLISRLCSAAFFFVLVAWLIRKVPNTGIQIAGAFLAFWLLTPTLYPWYLLWLMPFGAWFRSAAIWLGCAAVPLLHQAAFARASEGLWREALWPRIIFLLALGIGAYFDWRRWQKYRRGAPGSLATLRPSQTPKDSDQTKKETACAPTVPH